MKRKRTNWATVAAVYAIRHTASGRMYVGGSINVERRWQKHRYDLKYGRHHSLLLQRAWSKYGAEAFEFIVLEQVDNDKLKERERAWLETVPFYNNIHVIDSIAVFTEASRARMTAGQLRYWERRRLSGKGHLTEEHKARIAAGHRGQTHSNEAKANMRAAALGRVPWNKGKHTGQPSWNKGRKCTDAERARLSASHLGCSLTETHRNKISDGLKRAYAEGRRHKP